MITKDKNIGDKSFFRTLADDVTNDVIEIVRYVEEVFCAM